MKIHVNRETLMPALTKVGGVVERRQTLPILGNLLISAEDDSVQITGTDLEIEVHAKSGSTVEQSGEITLPARKLIEICRALPEGTGIALKVEENRASLVAGRSRFTLSTLPASDFPVMERNEGMQNVDVERQTLKHLFEKTAFAMAHQDVRYYLNGLLLELKSDRLVAVATDGHRLAKVEEMLPLGVEEGMQIVLPRKTVLELNRLLGGGDANERVQIEISEKMFRAVIGDVLVTSKLVDGRYPDYERVVPPAPERIAYVDRDTLKQALFRTSILSNEKYRGVRFSLDQGELRLQTQNPEKEEAEEELEITYSQEPMVIGFNVGYLIDILNVLEEDEVEIGFKDSDGSVILRNKGKERETFVVMPMRL
ncbi:DNA polymerase III subunit beta [Candidatus Thiosymbion oneisti]|uniref:DNA polymerase III subunit beta n=1 Tax=Candidatus Thiosymbion oneisti TaxID=589554 RepID=UPI000B10B6E9|nr:DNA polymerase III subunit beta [Candidatus Thiosymbion oneisti]